MYVPIRTGKTHTPYSLGSSFSAYMLEVGQAELKAKSVTGERILINSTT
jgi:hypothetical protein